MDPKPKVRMSLWYSRVLPLKTALSVDIFDQIKRQMVPGALRLVERPADEDSPTVIVSEVAEDISWSI